MTEPLTKTDGDWITVEWANSLKALVEDLPDQIGGTDYLVYKKDATIYAEGLRNGLSDYSGTNAFTVIQTAISTLPSGGGKIQFARGKYVLTSPLAIDTSAVTLKGQTPSGDLFFTNDGTYHGFSNKNSTTFVADAIDAIRIGQTNFVFGVTIENMGIQGKDSDASYAATTYSLGSGIRGYKVDTLQIRNVQVERKEVGIYLNPPTPFAFDKVVDVVNMENIYLSYNTYGLLTRNWVANVRINNLWGYYNQFGLLNVSPTYDWDVRNVWSNADSWQSTSVEDTPIYIEYPRDMTIENVAIAGGSGADLCPVDLIKVVVKRWEEAGAEWYRSHLRMRNILLHETDSNGITVTGDYGQVDIDNLHAGSTGNSGFYGGTGTIAGSVILAWGEPNVEINVHGGFVDCEQSKRNFFYLIRKGVIRDVAGFNPYGKITDPFGATTVGFYDPGGCTAAPTASTDYEVVGTDLLMTSSGGTGVSITIKDPAGTTAASGLATLALQFLPVGYLINFGAFSVAPTVIVSGI